MQFVSFDCAVAAGIPFELQGQRREPSPYEVAEYRESVGAIRSCLDLLPRCDRNVLASYFGLDCMPSTLTEIGSRMGVSREAARKRLLRAIAQLHRQVIIRRQGLRENRC